MRKRYNNNVKQIFEVRKKMDAEDKSRGSVSCMNHRSIIVRALVSGFTIGKVDMHVSFDFNSNQCTYY